MGDLSPGRAGPSWDLLSDTSKREGKGRNNMYCLGQSIVFLESGNDRVVHTF